MRQPVPAPRRPVSSVEVVVVGGGPLGAATAWQLARRGTEVVLLERFGSRHRTGPGHDATRIYRPAGAIAVGTPLVDEAERLWRELEAVTGASLLHITGGIEHGDPARLAELADRLASLGLAHSWLDPRDAADRWPGMEFEGPVLYQPRHCGRLNADHAVAALAAAATAHGATLRHHTRVTAITVRGPARVELDIDLPDGSSEVLRARRVVVAAGEWTAGLVDGHVRLPRLRIAQETSAYFPVSDEYLPCGACSARWPTFVHHGRDVGYGLPVPGRGVKVSIERSEAEAGRDYPDSGRSRVLRDHVTRWLPGADPARATASSRSYSVLPRAAVVIERNGPIVVGTGVSSAAFDAIPALGRQIADLSIPRAQPARPGAIGAGPTPRR